MGVASLICTLARTLLMLATLANLNPVKRTPGYVLWGLLGLEVC